MTGERGEIYTKIILVSFNSHFSLTNPNFYKLIIYTLYCPNSCETVFLLFFLSKCQRGDKGKGVNNKIRLMSVIRAVM